MTGLGCRRTMFSTTSTSFSSLYAKSVASTTSLCPSGIAWDLWNNRIQGLPFVLQASLTLKGTMTNSSVWFGPVMIPTSRLLPFTNRYPAPLLFFTRTAQIMSVSIGSTPLLGVSLGSSAFLCPVCVTVSWASKAVQGTCTRFLTISSSL